MIEVEVSLPLAFAAGLVSFLSPCILPVVPSYLAYVTGLTLDELQHGTAEGAARAATVNSTAFVLGFALVFMTMGWAATSLGQTIAQALPWLNRAGGAALIFFGLYMTGVIRLPALAREIRVHLASRPTGFWGSLAVGVAFGAGWTPCIGPVLASILLYASLETTTAQGIALLGAYAFGLGIPFVAASVAFNRFVATATMVRRWLVPLERVAGTVLVLVGLLMVTGNFVGMTAFLAGLGQLVNLEVP